VEWLGHPLLSETKAEAAIPIAFEGELFGVLDVQADQIGQLDEIDANMLQLLANQAAIALRNARRFADVENTLAEARATQARYTERAWQEQQLGRPEYNYHRADTPPLDEAVLNGLKQAAIQQDKPAVIAGQNDKPTPIVAPIKVQNQVVGTMHFLESDPAQQRQWTKQEIALVQAIADQVAQSAENLRLFEATRDQAGREQTIREVTDKLKRATNLDALLETAARELGLQLGARHTVLEMGIDRNTNGADMQNLEE
jgi:GAF domain-containing protein